jgi:hypothetical protein
MEGIPKKNSGVGMRSVSSQIYSSIFPSHKFSPIKAPLRNVANSPRWCYWLRGEKTKEEVEESKKKEEEEEKAKWP